MTAEVLLALARANVAGSLAILLVLALRAPARRWFGAHRAYALWLAVPLAVAGSLTPAAGASGAAGPVEVTSDQISAWLSTGHHGQTLVIIWLAGFAASLAFAASRQLRFLAAVKAGLAGPAAVGVFAPRMVAPADFALRFTDEERRLIRAHERAHMDRLDARFNALALLAACASWFNPLAHLALRALRLDQEVACDATVMQRLPAARRAYALTLLRTQQTDWRRPLLGCQWLEPAAHPLETRVSMLARRPPSNRRRDLGLAALASLGLIVFAAGWALQPPWRAAPQPTVILMDIAPPSPSQAALSAWVYGALPKGR
jgi:beta-lactamase regulating signal transducer with metallopeptidase domain